MPASIREQILAHWLTTLQTISVDNGYHTDLDLVERFTLKSMDQHQNIIIEVKQGTDRRDEREDNIYEYRVLTIHTLLKVRHDPESDSLSTDTVFNAIEEDIHKAVMTDLTRNGLAIPPGTRFDVSEGVEVDESGTRGGKNLVYTVAYRHVRGDMTQ